MSNPLNTEMMIAAGFMTAADAWANARGLTPHAHRPKVALAIVGQSNERGSVLVSDMATFPQAFGSLVNPAEVVPISPAVTINGGWWHYVQDALHDWGYDLRLVNGAIGGASVMHMANYLRAWVANYSYASKRSPIGPGDRGDFGDLIVAPNNMIFRCISGGQQRFALNTGPERANDGASGAYLDTLAGLNTGGTSGASAPDWASVAVGGTISDGALTWQRMETSVYAECRANFSGYLSDQYPAVQGRGFDPLGILQRTYEELMRVRGVTRRIVYIANGQSDLGSGPVSYGNALRAVAIFFLRRNVEVMIGLTMNAPAATNNTETYWSNLSTGVANAIAALQADYPGKVHAGANLRNAMGASGPIGGRLFTGSISGSTLTVTATGNDGAIEVGHTITDTSGNVKGVVSALGTGTGGTGTYALTGAVTTASSALRAQGAFFSPLDGIHLNGAGCVGPDIGGVACAGKYVADAVKALFVPI